MDKRKRFRLRAKPRKPKRQEIKGRIDLSYMNPVSIAKEILAAEAAGAANWDYEDGDDYFDTSSRYTYRRPETDEEFADREEAYKHKKQKYDAWYKENKEAIEEELRLREAEKKAAELKRQEKEKKALEKEQVRIEKRLAKLKKGHK